MDTSRLEAFSDGVFAVIITIVVLGVRVPTGDSFAALAPVLPTLVVYIWSFQIIATYWNNHHHLVHAAQTISTRIMWSNMALLFWLSLIPFSTEWLGKHVGSVWPSVVYAFILLGAASAYALLQQAIVAREGKDSAVALAIGKNTKGKVSNLFYFAAVIFAFIQPVVSYAFIVAVSLIWFIPDRRLRKLD